MDATVHGPVVRLSAGWLGLIGRSRRFSPRGLMIVCLLATLLHVGLIGRYGWLESGWLGMKTGFWMAGIGLALLLALKPVSTRVAPFFKAMHWLLPPLLLAGLYGVPAMRSTSISLSTLLLVVVLTISCLAMTAACPQLDRPTRLAVEAEEYEPVEQSTGDWSTDSWAAPGDDGLVDPPDELEEQRRQLSFLSSQLDGSPVR